MKKIGVYPNLERELESAGIKRVDLTEILGINKNTITSVLSDRSSLSFKKAVMIKDYLSSKTGKDLDLEYLFRKD